jgi:hypothetical protein
MIPLCCRHFNNLTGLRVDAAVDVVSETYRLLFICSGFEQ